MSVRLLIDADVDVRHGIDHVRISGDERHLRVRLPGVRAAFRLLRSAGLGRVRALARLADRLVDRTQRPVLVTVRSRPLLAFRGSPRRGVRRRLLGL